MTAAKAWVAGLFLIIQALVAALADDSWGLSDVQSVIAAIVVAAGGVYAVYQTRNRTKTPLE